MADANERLDELNTRNEAVRHRVQASADTIVFGIEQDNYFPVDSSLDLTSTMMYMAHASVMSAAARSAIRDVDPGNELIVLRIGTRKNEVMITHDPDFCIVAVQQRKLKKSAL